MELAAGSWEHGANGELAGSWELAESLEQGAGRRKHKAGRRELGVES